MVFSPGSEDKAVPCLYIQSPLCLDKAKRALDSCAENSERLGFFLVYSPDGNGLMAISALLFCLISLPDLINIQLVDIPAADWYSIRQQRFPSAGAMGVKQ
jgi:hypothetical protein